jgi:uncharacterized protein DUF1579
MKKLTFVLLALSTVFVSFTTSAQNNSDDMKAMMAYATPGDVHKMLAKSAGSWTGTVSVWMQPGQPAMTATATATNEMILGGRYLQSKNTGTMFGQPFEGVGVTGYDNAKKMFFNTWIDNFGTGIMSLTGSWDDASKSINFSGTEVDPVSKKDVAVREVWKFLDDNNQVMSLYMTMNGQEAKTMEIKYVRK